MESENWRARLAHALGAQVGTRIGPSYVFRTTLAATASLLVSRVLHIANPIWAVVSAVVVILPELRASVASAGLRVVANLIGAAIGIGIAFVGVPPIPSLVLGLVAVGTLCHLIGLDAAARSANVALIIVLLRAPNARGVIDSSETRVLLVLIGCATALLVTIVAAQTERTLEKWRARKAA
jgi:uncharacterized membrane protein YgaE (UPF0421/DUF939 family)